MDAAGKSRVLDVSALDFDTKPVRVRSVENDGVDGSLIQTFDPGQYAPVELVPDLSAGTAGYAIPVAAPRPAATYRGGSFLPAEAPPPQSSGSKFVAGGYEVPFGHEEELLAALRSLRRPKGPGTRLHAARARARSSRGRPVRRRGSRRITRASSSDDPGLGEPPGHRPPVGRPA